MDLEKTLDAFRRRGWNAIWFQTKEEAADYLCAQLHDKTIGIGGSGTVDKLGIYERLQDNNTVYWHWKQGEAARSQAANAEIYLSSANALSEDGQMVNIDGNGNRVAQTLYGHEKVYIVAGVNKLTPDLDSAVWRARNIASPLNARRFQVQTPCVLSEPMKCHDCQSPQRICKGMVITMGKPSGIGELTLILIGEELGY